MRIKVYVISQGFHNIHGVYLNDPPVSDILYVIDKIFMYPVLEEKVPKLFEGYKKGLVSYVEVLRKVACRLTKDEVRELMDKDDVSIEKSYLYD